MSAVATRPVVPYDPLKDSRHREAAAARDLADWLKWLELGNKAARTLDTYERVVAVLLRDFPRTPFHEFTDGDIMHVLAQFPPRSRATNKAAINMFFKWGYQQRRIPGNPCDLLPEIKYKPNRSYDIFSEAEADALCALPIPDGPLLSLMFWTGLRRSECRLLTGKRVDLAQGQVVVVDGAKGGKTRRVPLISRAYGAMDDLLEFERIAPNEYLWYDHPGGGKIRRARPIGNTSFDNWWKRCITAAAVRHRNPHMARHTYATRMRGLGVPMEDIQHLLGHESIRTTSDTYVHSNLDALAARVRLAVGDPV